MPEKFDFKPLRIGEILDRSFKLWPKALKPPLLITLALIYSIHAIHQYFAFSLKTSQSASLAIGIVITTLLVAVLNYYFVVFTTYVANALWLNEAVDIRIELGRIRFFTMLQLFVLTLRIGIVTFLYALLLIIPGIIYACNRILSIYIFLIEEQLLVKSMEKSKRLMTHRPGIAWYSPKTPLMRFSGMIIVTFIIQLIPAMVVGYGQMHVQTGQFGTVEMLTVFASSYLTGLVTVFVTLAYVGFYYDLRTRAEGLDMERDLAALSNNQTAIP